MQVGHARTHSQRILKYINIPTQTITEIGRKESKNICVKNVQKQSISTIHIECYERNWWQLTKYKDDQPPTRKLDDPWSVPGVCRILNLEQIDWLFNTRIEEDVTNSKLGNMEKLALEDCTLNRKYHEIRYDDKSCVMYRNNNF